MSRSIPSQLRRPLLAVAAALLLGVPPLAAVAGKSPVRPDSPDSPENVAFFEARVRPLLLQKCVSCHSHKVAQGGLRLDDPQALQRGGAAGPVVVPGRPAESRLIRAVRYADPRLQMPPAGKLPEADIRVLEQWIEQGAALPWDPLESTCRHASLSIL